MPSEAPQAPVMIVTAEVEVLPQQPTKEDLMLKCSCISYMRERGHKFPIIENPSFLKPNSMPIIGGLVLFKFGNYDHIGEIIDLRPKGMFIHHRYLSGTECITTTGYIEYNKIRGVYKDEIIFN